MDFLLNRRIVLYGVGGVTLAVLVVALARVFRDILTVLLLIIILALVVVVVLMWLKQRKAAQGSAEIESTIVSQADRDIERSIPAQAADLQNMKADLLAAIEALKSSKGGGGALATLPWYLVMGAKGAGKGTLVQNSGLNFPLKDAAGRGPRSVKGVGGTRSLEWWLSEEAVLLEVPGGLLRDSQFEDTDDWIAFLGVLRKQRPARPINGVIVPISVDQVAETPAADVEKFARRVRERVLELNHHLGVTFPTYIVLTGCDRIAGFTEFFAGLDAAKRGQAWGATVPVAQALERPAEELFDAEFQTLTGTLARRWVGTLGGLEDDEQRTRAFAFPLQLERMRPTLRLLVRTLYDAGGPGERPLFRGFYLTSAAPSGAAVDRVYGPAAIALGLNAGAASAPTPAAGGSWFVSDLFTKVIFPDRDMVTESTQRVERRRLARVMLAASLGLVLLVLLAFFAVVSVMNGDPIDHVRREAEHLRRVSAGGAFEDRVEGIDRLRAQIVRLEGLRQHLPWWRHLGGYWGDDVIDPALQVYARHALSNLVRPALPQMDNDLAAMVASPQPAFVPAFYEYWAWRLLRKPDEMRAGDARVIAGVVRRSLASDLAGVPTAKRDAVGGMVEQDVDFLVAHEKLVAQNESVYLTPEPASLAQNAAAWLRQRWDRQAIYDDVIGRQVAAQVKPLTLAELIGRTPEPLSSDASVPGAYTREGWAKVVSPLLAWYRERLGGPWVEDVADSARVLAVDLGDRYASSYTRAWIDFLGHVKASSSPNRQTCAGLVNDITRDGSPLFALLGGAAGETRFTHEPGPGIDRVQQDFEMLQGFEIAPGEARKPGFFGRIGRWFGGLFGKKKSAGGTFDTMSSDKQNYVRQLGVLATKVQALAQPSAASQAYNEIFISLSPTELCQVDQFKASAQALIDKHRGHPGNDATVRALWLPLTTLAQVGPIPDPPRDVAAPPTPVVAGGVAPARAFLPPDVNAKWQLEVVAPFNAKLAGKYPLSASGPDLPLADFAEFFKPGGTFWKFYDAALKPYLAEDGTPAPGAVGVVPPGLIRAVRTARDIRDAFFAVGADPALRFMVRNGPPDTVHVTARYTLAWIDFEVGGQKPVHYTMGAATWNPLTWPGPQPSQGAAVRASGFNMTFVAQEKEVWGLFRLLDRGVFGGTETVPRVTVHVTSGKDVWNVPLEFQLEGESPKHPFRRNFLRFQLPPSI